ncbi:YebC/PmpR family DNA-binding transcriptional regulator [Spiroplasma endosymbiont of Asaphidion curtum]|uniref:YebC/PmpR family DNA-binding transcriptional regulator n=1 Tax=Spiroplasma endosymbiont of Asaphidion curtum TaxID=3066281 RepID=UPI00313E8103
MAGHSKWANIKHRKAAQDKIRGKIFQKILRQLNTAVRNGGINIETNNQLRLLIEKAKTVNMPKENIDRALKKFSQDNSNLNYEEIIYEGFVAGHIAVMVECLTDNRNRTATNVRSIFNKAKGTLGVTGSVRYLFTRVGLLVFTNKTVSVDKVFEWALEIAAIDVNNDEGTFIITTTVDRFWITKTFLESKGVTAFDVSEIIFQPNKTVSLKNKIAIEQFWQLINSLEDDDDVQNIYYNFVEDDN